VNLQKIPEMFSGMEERKITIMGEGSNLWKILGLRENAGQLWDRRVKNSRPILKESFSLLLTDESGAIRSGWRKPA
jgi:hypothetical protein